MIVVTEGNSPIGVTYPVLSSLRLTSLAGVRICISCETSSRLILVVFQKRLETLDATVALVGQVVQLC